jgi:Peptidase family M1 domain/Peptidase M1 N-terminal domain
MKRFFLFTAILFSNICLFAQVNKPPDNTGHYQVDYYPSRKLNVTKVNNSLFLEIVGQGKTELIPLGGNSFKAKYLPGARIDFIRDSVGSTIKFKWSRAPGKAMWNRVSESDPNISNGTPENLAVYTGKYSVKGNGYPVILIKADSDHLTSQNPGEIILDYYPLSKNKFIYKNGEIQATLEFIPDKQGKMTRMESAESGDFYCSKLSENPTDLSEAKHNFTQRTGFTRADTLMGMLSPLRTCYDVLFYDLDVKIDPETRFLQGKTIIRFNVISDFNTCQVDLFANMKIEKILFHNSVLGFKRVDDAVFIQFPDSLKKGAIEEIQIVYSGIPRLPDMSTLSGGFIWTQDKNGKPWIETVVQGSGASLWWPCKDHLSDKPDSLYISVTVPAGLSVVANGSFIGKTDLPNKLTRFQWAVHYPINNYNVVLYIGDYAHVSEEYELGSNRFPLNYYFLSYHPDQAAVYARHVKPMLELYQHDFGPYPFPKDGYALVESPYGMEHQSAVSIGTYTNPANEKPTDTTDNIRTLWHESAHEWWGNSVTCSDMADFWIHESFATYAEVLCYEKFNGMAAAVKYLKEQVPENKESIIGFYGVNDFHMGDMYSKGCRMIATLRNTINNDSLFFSILRGIQKKYKYQSINTADIVNYFNNTSGTDYTYIFDQYLRYGSIPKLIISASPSGKDMELRYKWVADVKDFRLPVKLSTGSKEPVSIYPTTEWKTIHLENCRSKDLHFDTVYSYFDLESE